MSNDFYENFKIGKFGECLNELRRLEENSNSFKDNFEKKIIISNNQIICEFLACNGDRTSSCNITCDQLLLVYDNCVLTSTHCEVPLSVRLVLLYNSAWIQLFKDEERDFQRIYDRFIQLSSRICSGSTDERSQLPLHEEFQIVLNAKKIAISAGVGLLSLFTEIINMILMKKMPFRPEHHVSDFIKGYLEDRMEMTAMSSQPSGLILPMVVIDWNGSPSEVSNLQIEQPLSLMEVILTVADAGRNASMHVNGCRSSSSKSKWNSFKLYVAAYNAYQVGEDNQALHCALIARSSASSGVLSANLHLLLGQIYSNLRERHKAIENFGLALSIVKEPMAYYCLGRELSKLGLYDSMFISYQNLVKVITRRRKLKQSFQSFEEKLLDALHQDRQITKPGALYILALAYGLNEMFEESSELFDEITKDCNMAIIMDSVASKAGFEMPHIATLLHEAATIFLLTGKLYKAQSTISQAMQAYTRMQVVRTDVHGSQDHTFIRHILEDGFNIGMQGSKRSERYYEDYLCTFEEDVIGLMILAEIQTVSGSPDARLTINQVLVLLSKYMARTQKEKSEANMPQVNLINALTSKTCLRVAKMLSSSGNFAEVNKMFKRALFCNNADKDALYHYTQFLIASGKVSDAEKLWHTFESKELIIQLDDIQSLALRHLLRRQTSNRQIFDLLLKLKFNTTVK